jgi:branched-subunit amino acid aminotransferase/4-amino-4-deoxychorismate lyase
MNNDNIHFLNGKFVSEKDLLISPRDLGYSRGFAVFDFLETYEQKPFMLERHIDRLFMSAETISLDIPWSKKEVTTWVLKTIEANNAIDGEKVIRITVSGGPSLTLSTNSVPTIVITVEPKIGCPADDYKNGVEIALVEFERYRPEAKTNNYIEAVRILKQSRPKIDEIIYHSDNTVREGSRCNIFALVEERLITPKTKILAGVTRDVLLDKIKLSIPALAEDFSVESLCKASEIFITATGKGIMPVTKIDGLPVGNGKVGDVTKEVMHQYHAFMRSNDW